MPSDESGAEAQDPKSKHDDAAVEREVAKVRAFAQGLSLDDLRNGTWFEKLLKFSLDRYVQEVDADYFRAKYPHLPADAVVDARIQMAARYSSIEGGLSAGAYTAAVAATIGKRGGASKLALPVGGASFVVDLMFTSRKQLRMAYDIAVIYGVPLDLSDPDDLWKLIRVAFAVKAGEVGREAMGKGVPVVVRPIVKKIFSGSTLATAKSLPVVGKYLLQRNIIKFAIPAIGVPVSVGVNYWSTKMAGTKARKVFREEARIAEAARRITERTALHDELLWVLWLIINSDGHVQDCERLLLTHVTAIVSASGKDVAALHDLRALIDLDRGTVWAKIDAAAGDRNGLFDAAVMAAAIDGQVNAAELADLRKLAAVCSVPFDEAGIREASRRTS
jgi:hypothetical protein